MTSWREWPVADQAVVSERLLSRLGDQFFASTRQPLGRFLTGLAEDASAGASGCLVFPLDGDKSLAFGAWGLEPDEERLLLGHLESLLVSAADLGRKKLLQWSLPLGAMVRILPLQHCADLVGLVAWVRPESSQEVSLAKHTPALSLAVVAAAAIERWRRSSCLQGLLHRTLEASEPAGVSDQLDAVVQDLASLFEAEVATVLLASDEELRLSASTDQSLDTGRPVVYRPGEGLTGWIFKSGRALCVDDTDDSEEVRRKTGLEQHAARFPERDIEGVITGQYLGVPMRSGGRVVGVIRISRRQGARRFTRGDEEALQQFADLLGTGLSQTFRLQLANSILGSVHEAIAVSRREIGDDGRLVTRLVDLNPGGERLLGRSRAALVGLDARTIYAPGEYDKVKQGLLQAVADLKAGLPGECKPIPCLLQRADGTSVAAVVSYRVLADCRVRPSALYTVGVAREASTSEEMASRYQRLLGFLDAMDIAFFRADRQGLTLESTPADARITGYSPEEIRSLRREQLWPDPSRQHQFLDIARKRQGRIERMLLQLQRKSGEAFWAEVDLRILRDADGEEVGVDGIYRDVTERMRLQHFLNEERAELLSDHELFTSLKQDAEFHLDYLSSVGHQILTPLSSLAGTLRNFEEGLLSGKELRERLPYITGQVRVCARLVRNLSFMDKILRSERFEQRPQPLARLAIETTIDFDHQLKEKRLALRIDRESLDRLGSVDGDRELLRQVFVNLVDNAIKYSVPRSTITIRGHQWSAGRGVEISNEGLSISKENRERVFDRGFRTPQARAHVPHGTGLGLWLVRRILAAHGAEIHCTDKCEGGVGRTVFRITFPHPKPSRFRRRSA